MWLDLHYGILEEFAGRAAAPTLDWFGVRIENRAGAVDKDAQRQYHQQRKQDPDYRARRADSQRRRRLGLPSLRGRGRPAKEAA